MATQAVGAANNLLNNLFVACLNAKIKHDKIKGMVYCLVGKELDDKVKELFGSLLVDWDDELYNKLRVHSLSLPKLANIKFEGKTILVGGPGVGKTSILNRLTSSHPEIGIPQIDLTSEESNRERTLALYDDSPKTTVDMDFQFLTTEELNLQIWDTAGHQVFIQANQDHVTRADFIIVVSDATNPDEEHVKYWVQVAEKCEKHWIHVANKYDTIKDIDPYGSHKYKPHFCVSARNGRGLTELRDFIVLAEFFAAHKQRLEFVDKTVNRTDAPSMFSYCIVL